MKIIAFGASYSKNSINKKFATFAATQFEGANTEVLDLSIYELPLYTVDKEKEIGHPEILQDFVGKLHSADLLVISMSEHNGSYTAAFKNLFDWTSRVELKMFAGKKMLLLSTATGPRGGLGVLEAAKTRFPIHGADIVGSFSLPRFNENFDAGRGILEDDLRNAFNQLIEETQNVFLNNNIQ